jgi:hypothetical protein
MKMRKLSLTLCALTLPLYASAQTVRSGSGADAAAILPTVTQFRTDLGGANNGIGAFAGSGGRREINWDAVPAGFSAPNNLPAGFFNQNSQRGLQLVATAGVTGFMVSDNAAGGNGAGVRFDNLNDTYSTTFTTFTPQKLFTSLGSNVYDITFFVPLTGPALPGSTPALVRGFGSVFTDVDTLGGTTLQYFDRFDNSLGIFNVPVQNLGLSFLGVSFDTASIARVRVTAGTAALGPGDDPLNGLDMVVADDFVYGEPVSVAVASAPEPGTLAFLALGGTLVFFRRRRAQ